MANENINKLLQITPIQLGQILKPYLRSKKQNPIFIWGTMGIGKSDIIASLTKPGEVTEKGGDLVDMRLAQMDTTALRGIPHLNRRVHADGSEDTVMVFSVPDELPTQELADKYDYVILFLDEMNSAPKAVQASAYQLILNRRIGKYHLPDNVFIIAAGNNAADKGVVHEMPAPLLNRFKHYHLTHDHKDWMKWAMESQIHPLVMGYIEHNASDLYGFSKDSQSKSFPTPRSWEFVSNTLYERDNKNCVPENLLMIELASSIGDTVASKLMAHIEYAKYFPRPEKILDGSITKFDANDINKQVDNEKKAMSSADKANKMSSNANLLSAIYSMGIECVYMITTEYEKSKPEVAAYLNPENKGKGLPIPKVLEWSNNFFGFILENFSKTDNSGDGPRQLFPAAIEISVAVAQLVIQNSDLQVMTNLPHARAFMTKYGSIINGIAGNK